ncbi:hypothetical protein JIY74_31025 [Vibrio harveyi]|nr:hypothetical protein [Vibrio harveyi]
MPTALVLPVFHIYKSNNKSEDFINSMTSDQTTNQLINRLNVSIAEIKEAISKIEVKINDLLSEKEEVESFLRRNLEQENEILSKRERLRLVEQKINDLQKEIEDKQALIHEKEQQINDLKSQITTLKDFFSNT